MSVDLQLAPADQGERPRAVERRWDSAELGLLADRPIAAALAALLLVARAHGDLPRAAIGLSKAFQGGPRPLDIDLPGDLRLSELVADVERRLSEPSAHNVSDDVTWFVAVDSPTPAHAGVGLSLSADQHGLRAALTAPGLPIPAERLMAHLDAAVGQLRDRPDAAVHDVDLRTAGERAAIAAIAELNAKPDGAANTTVVELFAAAVREAGAAVAVVEGRRALTYSDLDRASSGLAAALTGAGVGRGAAVGLLLGGGADLVVAMLAVLRAGAAYVPIDAASPALRRDHVLRDAGVTVLVTDQDVEVPAGVRVLDPGARAEPAPGEPPSPHDTAYVMYTSGSTGAPKGVVVSHRAVASRVHGIDYVPLTTSTRVLQAGSVAFDATTFEIWGPLIHGGTVVFGPSGPLTPQKLRAAVAEHGVNTMFLTTALFNQLVDVDPTCLRGCTALVGGEANSPTHFAKAFDACPDTTLIHVYGPTENTTFSTSHRLRRSPDGPVPIGRPISASTALVVSHEGRPVPIGVAGELWVGGAGVADGYLGQPELTAARFTEDGFYRTGDIVRWTEDLELEFIGRRDTQVKVRGFRIELGEVEAALRACPGVSDAAVVVAENALLRAFVTATAPVDVDALQLRLRGELPEYMVPSRFEQLAALPLTANNKLDRAALAAWRARQGQAVGGGGLAEQVARVFADVLDLPSVGQEDNFFALGGHSLLAIKIWSRLRADLGVEFELRHVIDAPTVAALVTELGAVLARRPSGARARPRLGARRSTPTSSN